MQILLQHNRGKILGYLIRVTGDFADAEDICQDVMLTALTDWQANGMPEQPVAWLYKVARNKVIDQSRRRKTAKRYADMAITDEATSFEAEQLLEDAMLRLIFTCCHPALAPEVRVPLTLRLVAGFSLEEVARAYLMTPKSMEQRITRAKRKIQVSGIAYEVPSGKQLEDRLASVMQTLYLMFTEGYAATRSETLLRESVSSDAIRLCTLIQKLFPGRAELLALLSLMLLQHSRRRARTSPKGELVLLDQQDRKLWDAADIQKGLALLDKALSLKQIPGVYQLQAAIAALHCQEGETDWQEISLLYQRLLDESYSPVAHLSYAVAVSMLPDLPSALRELKVLEEKLSGYQPFYCARADIYHRAQNKGLAIADYEAALKLSTNAVEKGFVMVKLEQLRA